MGVDSVKKHEHIDKAAAKGKLFVDVPCGGSFTFNGRRVSVYEVESLARGRLHSGMLEFFLKFFEMFVEIAGVENPATGAFGWHRGVGDP